MPELTVAASIVSSLVEFAVAAGAQRGALLAQSGIDADQIIDRDGRIGIGKYQTLVTTAKALTGNPALALDYAEQVDLSDVSIVGLITRASANMVDALAQLNRFGKLVVEVETGLSQRFEVLQDNGQIWLIDNRINPNTFPELTEITLARLATGPRRFTDQLKIGAAHFTHQAPAYAAEYRRVFDAPIVFESHRNALMLDPSWFSYSLSLAPSYVFGILTGHAQRLMEELEATTSWSGRTKSILLPILHTGDAKIDRAARDLKITRQTLYRKLKAEGTTFERLLDELRYQTALHYLEGKKVSINETAYLTGFSDRAAFSKAFKRWTSNRKLA